MVKMLFALVIVYLVNGLGGGPSGDVAILVVCTPMAWTNKIL